MTAKLTLVLLAALTARGAHHHERHPLGPYVRAEQLAERTILAAQTRRVPVTLYASLLLAESNMDPAARSRTGAVGIPQLQPPGPFWKAWRADCRAMPSACEQASLFAGARALRAALNACRGDRYGWAVWSAAADGGGIEGNGYWEHTGREPSVKAAKAAAIAEWRKLTAK